MRIIPAIDLIEGKCVRLEKGDYARKKVYQENPLEVAKKFEAHGLKYLHLVDLDGAKAGKIVNARVLEKLATHTQLRIDFGGGIKSDADVKTAFDAGAQQINIGSTAVKDRALMMRWIEQFGPESMILSADVKEGKIAIDAWQRLTDIDLMDFIKDYRAAGIRTISCTDIAKDGMLQGASVDLYQEVMKAFPDIQLVASGGVTSLEDIERLQQLDLFGAIVGKAIYEGRISLKDLGAIILRRSKKSP